MPGERGEAVAIVAMGCILPDAANPDAFWENTLRGHSAVRPLRGSSWHWERHIARNGAGPDRSSSALGAPIENFALDWRRFKMPPADAQRLNPMQLVTLAAGAQTLENVKRLPLETSGIYLGATGLGWRWDTGLRVRMPDLIEALRASPSFTRLPPPQQEEVIEEARSRLDKSLAPASEENVVSSAASIAAGRIAMQFDLRGPHFAIDAGFASSLAALEAGMRALDDGTVDLALVGGVSDLLSPFDLVAFSKAGVLAQSMVAPFDTRAEGTVLGEGCVFFALKRLEDALRDGETVHAVVLGVGSSSDGTGKAVMSPSTDGQIMAMRRAYQAAGVDPRTVGFVECHATGTRLGDVSEVRALANVYGEATRGSVALGSAKAFVGHLRGAAGAVGMLRAVLALRHRTIPAQINCREPNPELGLESSPFYVPAAHQPLTPRGAEPRVAVSAFGVGGINYHAILEAGGARKPVSRPRGRSRPTPIAVLGMGGIFPGSESVPAFWRSLLEGQDATAEVPAERWKIERYYDPNPQRLETTYTRIGCFVRRSPTPQRHWRIPPVALASLDPGHLMMLAAAEEALTDSGIDPARLDRARTGVMLGFMACQGRKLLADARLAWRAFEVALEGALSEVFVDRALAAAVLAEAEGQYKLPFPRITEDTLPGCLGSLNSGRIARLFDLHGPHFTVESACSSSLAAVHLAVQALRAGGCDTVITGGVWADMQPEFFVGSCRFNALSASGSTPFDARASGFVPGEGAGALVLRRLEDAQRDGQRILAVIRAVEGSSDGKGKSIFAPSLDGESMAMRRALDAAGVTPQEVDYVECHGTGTALGDAIEVEACTRTYGGGRPRPLLVGSVKSNIGHLLAGAGAPALMKTILALREGVIPKTLKVDNLNPRIDFAAGPVEVVRQKTPWPETSGRPRRAGVSSFGLGGTNFHAILEAAPAPEVSQVVGGDDPPARLEVLPIAAASGVDLPSAVRALEQATSALQQLAADEQSSARRTLQRGVGAGHRVAVVADRPDLLTKRIQMLRTAMERGTDLSVLRQQGIFTGNPDSALPVAAVFPGQGPQYPNMLRAALERFPVLEETMGAVDRAYEALAGRSLRSSFFTGDPQHWVQVDEDVHCAVFAVNVSLFRLFESFGLRVDKLLGQSAGELSALVAAGTLTLEEGLQAVRERTVAVLAIDSQDPGRMVALACGAERAEELLRGLPGYAAIAADNGPGACIVSAERAVAELVQKKAAESGIEAEVLLVSHGYHSQLIAAAQPRFRQVLGRFDFRSPKVEVFSTITGDSLRELPLERFPDHLTSQFTEPVRLRQAVQSLHRDGTRLFLECGPKWPLTTFVSQILAGRSHVAQASLHPKVGEVEQIHRALACLFVNGKCQLEPVREPVMNSIRSETPVANESQKSTAHAGLDPRLERFLRGMRQLLDDYLTQETSSVSGGGSPPTREAPMAAMTPAQVPVMMEARRNEAAPTIAPEKAPPPPPSTPAKAPVQASAPSPAPEQVSQPGATAPASGAAPQEAVQRALLDEFVKRTGYPEEMLELDLDMEAELGIDTVKQVAALAAVRERFGLQPDPGFKLREANTLRKAIAYLSGRINGAARPTAPAVAQAAVPTPPAVAQPRPEPEQPRPTASPQAAVPPPLPTPAPGQNGRAGAAVSASGSEEAVQRALLDEFVKRTGYPEEMLELDLDMEAELGIDTVKQVAALAAVRERFGLQPDPSFKLREANTLRKAIAYLSGRIASGPKATAPLQLGLAVEQPTRVIADSPEQPAKSVARTAARTVSEGSFTREVVAALLAAGGEIAATGLTELTVRYGIGEGAVADGPVRAKVVSRGQPGSETVRVMASGRHVSAEAVVQGLPTTDPPRFAADLLATVNSGARPSAGNLSVEIARAGGGSGQSSLEWARSEGFMVSVGGSRISTREPATGLIDLIVGASELASFAWFGLTGAPHRLAVLERAAFHRPPTPGEEVLFHAKMVPPEGGLWRADVTVLSPSGEVIAEIHGLAGIPARSARPAGKADLAAEEVWRRFRRHMTEPGPELAS